MTITAIADDQFPWATTVEDLLNFWTPGQGNGLSTFGAALDRLNVVAADVEVDALVDGDTAGNRAKINAIISALDIPEGAAFYGDLLNGRYYRTAQPSCVRASPAYALDLAGVYQAFGNDELRLTDAGLYVPEPAATNFLRNSSGLGQATWSTAAGATLGVGTDTSVGILLQQGATTGVGTFPRFTSAQTMTLAANEYGVVSQFVVKGSSPNFRTQAQNTGTSDNIATVWGWSGTEPVFSSTVNNTPATTLYISRGKQQISATVWRVWTVFRNVSGSSQTYAAVPHVANADSTAYATALWLGGIQMEKGQAPSSPIVTTTAAATRAADTVTIAAPSGTFDLHVLLDDATEEVIEGFQDGDALPIDLPQGKNIVKYWGVEA